MKINEITNTLKTFIAVIRIKNGSLKTSIQAENSNAAKLLLQEIYGTQAVTSVHEVSSLTTEATKTLTPQQLQVQALADKAQQFTQQKKQLVARQALAKAQEKMRQATATLS